MKALASISLLVSLALYLAQIFLYTKGQEILVYGVFGALWFLAMYLDAFSVQVRTTLTGIVVFPVWPLLAWGSFPIVCALALGSTSTWPCSR